MSIQLRSKEGTRARGPLHLTISALAAIALGVTGCSGADQAEEGDAHSDQAGNTAEQPAFDLTLDLDTLQVTTDVLGTLQAEEWEGAYVAAINEDLYIGVVLGEEAADDTRPVTAYLCDDDGTATWLEGDLDADSTAHLGGFEEGASIELAYDEDNDIVGGSAVVSGHETGRFAAQPAHGDAGLYRSIGADPQDFDLPEQLQQESSAAWVVLPEGEQQGGVTGHYTDFMWCMDMLHEPANGVGLSFGAAWNSCELMFVHIP